MWTACRAIFICKIRIKGKVMQENKIQTEDGECEVSGIIRKHIVFYGRVQAVGFRYYSRHKARQLGLAGWVKNLDDGSVEMEVQGQEAGIDQLILFLDNHRWIRIDAMDVTSIPVISDSDFVER